MAFLQKIDIDNLKEKLNSDLSSLGKIYKAKKKTYQTISVDHSLVEDYVTKGWEIEKTLVTKTRLIKAKTHSRKFEDDVWCV